MSVYRWISHSTNERPILLIWNMLMGFDISKSLAQSKINQMNYVRFLLKANQKVLRLEVSMHIILPMNFLNLMNLSKRNRTIWSASMRTVFRLNDFSHIKKRSSRVGPSSYITIKFDRFSWPTQNTWGNPTILSNNFNIFDYEISCGVFVDSDSYLIMTVPFWLHKAISLLTASPKRHRQTILFQ